MMKTTNVRTVWNPINFSPTVMFRWLIIRRQWNDGNSDVDAALTSTRIHTKGVEYACMVRCEFGRGDVKCKQVRLVCIMYMYVYTICMCIYIYTYVHNTMYVYVYVHMRMSMYMNMCMCMFMYMYTYYRISVCICICICIRICICIFTYAIMKNVHLHLKRQGDVFAATFKCGIGWSYQRPMTIHLVCCHVFQPWLQYVSWISLDHGSGPAGFDPISINLQI